MNILVRKEYQNANYGALIVTVDSFPFNVAPDMVCNELKKLSKNEIVYLGKIIPHHYPSDVIAIQCDDKKVIALINAAYELPLEYVAKFLDEEVDYEFETQQRHDMAGLVADEYINTVRFNNEMESFYHHVDSDKDKGIKHLSNMKKIFPGHPEVARAETYFEIF